MCVARESLPGVWECSSPAALVHLHASSCSALHYRRVLPWASVLTGAISPSRGHPGASGWHSVAWFPLGLAWLSGKCRSAEGRRLAAKLPGQEGCGRSPALSKGRSECPLPVGSLRISSTQLEQQAFKPAVLRRVSFLDGFFLCKLAPCLHHVTSNSVMGTLVSDPPGNTFYKQRDFPSCFHLCVGCRSGPGRIGSK